MTKASQREVEYKIDLPGRKALRKLGRVLCKLGLRPGPARLQCLRDIYLDTEDRWFYRAGAACRLRLPARQRPSLELKTLTPATGSMAVRLEIGEPLAGPPAEPIRTLPGRVLRQRVARLIGTTRVEPLFTLDQKRRVMTATVPSGLRVAVSADDVRIAGTGVEFREVELELVEGRPRALRALGKKLRRRLKGRPGPGSKYARGLQAAGLEMPCKPPPARALHPDTPFGAAVYRILQTQFALLLWYQPGVLLGFDPEKVHDMRVAARRLAAALQIFAFALPARAVAAFRADLKRITRPLGRLRDLDIYLDRLAEAADEAAPGARRALAVCIEEGRAAREREHRRMVRVFLSGPVRGFPERFARFLARGQAAAGRSRFGRLPVAVVAPELVRVSLRKTIRRGRRVTAATPMPQLHKLRRRCRKLRYLGEFFSDVYGKPISRLVRRVEQCQDVLGRHQDAVVVRGLLRRFRAKRLSDRARLRLFDQALHHLTAAGLSEEHDRAAFRKAWARLDRRKLCQRVLRDMARRGNRI